MKEKLRWFFERWLSMRHPQEDIYRIRQLFQNQFGDFLLREKVRLENPLIWRPSNMIDYDEQAFIKQNNNSNVQATNSYSFYDVCIKDIRTISDWRKDYKNNVTSLLTPIRQIRTQNFRLFGDIRYVATLSRLHHLPVFLSINLSKNRTEAVDLVYTQLYEWNLQNPFIKTINWKNGIEIGIRIANLIYTRKVLDLYKDTDVQATKDIIDSLVWKHFIYLPKHLSLYSSANNHLLFELMGIFLVSCYYESKLCIYWRQRSFDWLMKELLLQTHEDGFTKEQSSHYHQEVINIYVMVFREAIRNGMTISKIAMERFERMGESLAYLIDEDCPFMAIGDNDEGQILYPYFDSGFSLKKSLLRDIYMITGKSFLNDVRELTHYDLRNFFIWGNTLKKKIPELSYFQKAERKIFPQSGYLILNHGGVKLLFDFGSLGFGKLAAHGHADALQVLLSINDEPFLIDPGTYQYHKRFADWRNYFRGTLAHNTVSAEGKDQAKSAGRMMWQKHPIVVLNEYEVSDSVVKCSASHDGFMRQGIPVQHTRELLFDSKQEHLTIKDELIGEKNIEAIFSLHFAPHLKVELQKDVLIVRGNKGRLHLKNADFINGFLQKEQEGNGLGGWCSEHFDKLVSTTTFRMPLTGKDKVSRTEIIIYKQSLIGA